MVNTPGTRSPEGVAPISLVIERLREGACVLHLREKMLEKMQRVLGTANGREKTVKVLSSLEFIGHGVVHGAAAVQVDHLRLQLYEGLVYFLGGTKDGQDIALPFTEEDTVPDQPIAQDTAEMPALSPKKLSDEEVHYPRPAGIMIDYDANRLAVPQGDAVPMQDLTPDRKKAVLRETAVRSAVAAAVYDGNSSADTMAVRFQQRVIERKEAEVDHRQTHLQRMYLLNAYPQEPSMQEIIQDLVREAGETREFMNRSIQEVLKGMGGSLWVRAWAFITRRKLPAAAWAAQQLRQLRKK